MPPTSEPTPAGGDDPFRVFHSRRGRAVAIAMAVIAVVVFVGLAVTLPTATPTDRVLIAAIGFLIAGAAWRYATIRAVPTRDALVVRNLVTTRRLSWPQIVGVQFGGGAPWVTLDLDDTDQLAVMAIQRADGQVSTREAARLAALVQALGTARRTPPSSS